ncbi:hypothetical protein QZH41_010251 [Actinostola sp. cb2023]|nr:hypothetical protein QZH41_010251 [Actinostola sp. cb2023]
MPGYMLGTNWCNLCRVVADNRLCEHETYCSGNSRRKIVKFTRSPISQICECMGQPHDTDNSAPPLRTMQQLFWTLSYCLHCLAVAHGITLTVDPSIEPHAWHALSTPFGNAHINENGDALLVADEWDKIIKQLYQSKDMSLESLVEKFQIALHNHYIEGGTPLYNVTEMRDFTEKHAPGLFKLILCSIAREGNSITKNRQSLQDQRVVALLHIIAYFRSQKTSAFQKDLGLYLNHHGTSRSALNSGPLLRFSAAPRTIDRHNKQLLENYPNQMNQVIEDAEKAGKCMILLLDDFHAIYTIRMPDNLKLSRATHMASSLLDIHDSITAVKIPSSRDTMHSQAMCTIKGEDKVCRGGIVKGYVHEFFKAKLTNLYHQSYLSTYQLTAEN